MMGAKPSLSKTEIRAEVILCVEFINNRLK
jgi:hypothetical protein